MYSAKLVSLIAILGSMAAYAETPLEITDKGVGPVTANTPFDLKTLQHLLPDLKVRKSVGVSQGEPFDIIVAYKHRKPQLTIAPASHSKTIFCIAVTSKAVKNGFGATIGEMYKNIYDDSAPPCVPAKEEMSGLEVCAAPHAKNIAYVFVRNKRWDSADGVVPPYAIIKDWTLKQITWMADDKDVFKNHQLCKSEDIFANN